MKHVASLLDSTYLKTAKQASLSDSENQQIVNELAQEAIAFNFKLVMIRPGYVRKTRMFLDELDSNVLIGTVIDFPLGEASLEAKLSEAKQAIADGADELDFVVNYQAFQKGDVEGVKAQIKACTDLCLKNGKVAKWIIEIAALSNEEIASLTSLISEEVEQSFPNEVEKVYIKSSTGFYQRVDGGPVGATLFGVKIMKDNSGRLPIKVAGGVRNIEDVKRMLDLGVSRIGTSSAKQIILGLQTTKDY
tara:strand:- start:118 stop:861 length:744 start_codon:yes stop_codon:yes gene_type:complete